MANKLPIGQYRRSGEDGYEIFCTHCVDWKPENQFYPKGIKTSIETGQRILCKKHLREQQNTSRRKKYKEDPEHRERINAYGKASYQKHKTKRLKQSKEYRDTHKDEKKARDRKYYLDNRERIIEREKEYAKNHPEQVAATKRRWVENNPEKNRISKNKSAKKRKQTDPAFKLRKDVSSLIAKALKRNGGSKGGGSCFDFLPYTVEVLKQHIENQWEPWMNWGNHGIYNAKTWDDNDKSTWTWQIDHITPISKLPHTSMEDKNFQKAWALKNLRPLSAKRNVLEGNRRALPPSKKKRKKTKRR
jgi:hypothetical protein